MIVQRFLRLSLVAADLVESDDVRSRWDEPSALTAYTVGDLAGHLSRAVSTVPSYLDAPEPSQGSVIDAVGYFALLLSDADPVDSEFHRDVRRRAADAAVDGPTDIAAHIRSAVERMRTSLPESLDRRIEVRGGHVLPLSEYLRTRVVELVVHLDDLCVSVDRDGPDVDHRDYRAVAALLAELACVRGDGLATVRSLSRRERNPEPVRAL